jgi:predicted Zn-ribbon and HTH transcriptional regulator
MTEKPPSTPEPRQTTLREALRARLKEGPATARELSAAVGIREKDVAQHLEHLERSLGHRGEALEVEPARCLACGFSFAKRTRLTRPGKCPECGETRMDPPVFAIRSERG